MKMREDRWWNYVAAIFLFLALMMTTFRLESTNWTEDLYILKWMTTLGFLIGLAFGYSYFSSFISRLMLVIYSILAIPWALVLTTDSTLPWLDRLWIIINRFGITLGNLFNNIRIEDPILFTSFLAMLLWLTALTTGFQFTRTGKPWIPLLVSAITIFISEFYYLQSRNLYSSFFVIFALMVLSVINFMHVSKKWHADGTLVEYETTYNIGKSALIASIILVLLAWNISGIVSAFQEGGQREKLSGFFDNVRTQFTRFTAPLRGPLLVQQDFYGETIGLGTGAQLTDELVFEVSVDQYKPNGTRYYWRARTYDTYLNNEWNSNFPADRVYDPVEDELSYPSSQQYPLREFTFSPKINLGLLYTPMYPLQISQKTNVLATRVDGQELDLGALTLEQIMYGGENYRINARVPMPTISAMQKASEEYPDWVTEKYLQLPPEFSIRIRDLAQEITRDETNAFDKANAITLYLRNEITYQEEIPPFPANQDPIEWFLFDIKKGFCNYYASAEVLMLRSIGIPARMVYGYAQGEGDQDQTRFQVLRKQSHAWPEVFFPGIGWVEFEPTASEPALTRLTGDPISVTPADLTGDEFDLELLENPLTRDPLDSIQNIDIAATDQPRFQLIQLVPYLWFIMLIDLVALYIIRRRRLGVAFSPPVLLESFLQKRGWRIPSWLKAWSHYNRLEAAQQAFISIVFANNMLGFPSNPSATPAEIVKHFTEILPAFYDEANSLLNEYHLALYSQNSFDMSLMQQISHKIIWHALKKRAYWLLYPEERRYIQTSLE